jgi:succinate dehydrogenase / fumarate reductase cytochrome b subunit
MVLTGLTTLVFLVYHLLHFTLGVVHAGDYARGIGIDQDLHATMALSFGHPGIVLVYALGQVVLFLHLAHGIQSLAQTLGLHHARYTPMIRVVSWAIAAAIAAGNLLIATAVLSGIVGVAS